MATNKQSKQPANMLRCAQYQSHDLAECERQGPVLLDDLFAAIQGSGRCMAQRHLVRSQRPSGTHECRL